MSDEDHNHGLEGKETRVEIEEVKIPTSQSQANSSHNKVEKQLRAVEQLQKKLYPTERKGERPKKKVEIKRIPEIMKRMEKFGNSQFNSQFGNYFKPKWTFGPIHNPDASNCEIKLKLAAFFISENGSTQGNIFEKLKTNMDGIRACFGEDIISAIGDEELMGLLFLDGCAMLGFMHCYVNWQLKEVGISDVEAADIERDLLLLENQIPFQVLEVLIGSGTERGKEDLKGSLVKFIYLICRGTFPGYSAVELYEYLEKYCFSPERNKNQKAVHLLDVFREALVFNPPSFDLFWCLLTVIRGAFWILCSCGCLAITYFLERFKSEPYYKVISLSRIAEFFFRAQELKEAGINFKPSHSLTSVSFRYLFFFRAQLTLPTLIVDDTTAYKLVNLVAYEMCLSESRPKEKPWVSSYVNLLGPLVDNKQDIKDLREAGILRNNLSTDLDAARFIYEVYTGCSAPTEDAYRDVKEKIEKHNKKKWRRKCAIWMEQVYVGHFNSPWTILALFATTTALLLTAIQTWYAINPKK